MLTSTNTPSVAFAVPKVGRARAQGYMDIVGQRTQPQMEAHGLLMEQRVPSRAVLQQAQHVCFFSQRPVVRIKARVSPSSPDTCP